MINYINNKNFYPTPPSLCSKMVAKIKGHPKKILEPEAGKGDLAEAVYEKFRYSHGNSLEIFTIEIDEELQACLRGKKFKLVDSDFLTYSGPDKYDLIIANPPFDNGEKHLLKAINIMYRGQIIFLLNAETIKNPYTRSRKEMVEKLNGLGAEIEYIPNAFVDAERQTDVEVALINIVIDRKVEDDLFAECGDHAARCYETIDENYAVSTGRTIEELVAEYNDIVKTGIDTIVGYYKNYRKIASYIGLNHEPEKYSFSRLDLTDMMQRDVNDMLKLIRINYWRKVLDLKEVHSRLTKKKQDEFEENLKERCYMDFTESNIRQFVLNFLGGAEKTLTDAVLEIFDMFTVRHCYDGGVHEKNIHYYNGWKTNKAFKVGKRVVIPIYGAGCGDGPFRSWNGWKLNWDAARTLRDIDVVMNYFDGMASFFSIADALENAFNLEPNAPTQSGIDSTYFKITVHKKGTIHLTFKDEDILRRFNVVACRGKNWLPGDFGTKSYESLSCDEQSVVDSFEGRESYDKFVNVPLFGMNISRQMIGYDIMAPPVETNEESASVQTFIEWEQEVTWLVENILEVPTSDAQGILEVQTAVLQQAWGEGLSADKAANKIIEASAPKQEFPIFPIAPDPEYAQPGLF